MGMIFDRTSYDVEKAKEIREEKVQMFLELTDDEKKILSRGTVTIDTLNRIERKCYELKLLINQMGYWNNSISTNIETKKWSTQDIFDSNNFLRICQNLDILRNSFFSFFDTPKTPTPRYHFQTLNDIEKILYDLEKMACDIRSLYRECGNLECGGV